MEDYKKHAYEVLRKISNDERAIDTFVRYLWLTDLSDKENAAWFEYQVLRWELSRIIADKHPTIDLIIEPLGTIGLNDLEKPHVVGLFEDAEGIIWLQIEGCKEPVEMDDYADCIEQIIDYLKD